MQDVPAENPISKEDNVEKCTYINSSLKKTNLENMPVVAHL